MTTLVSSSTISGQQICNSAGEELGEIRDLMLDVHTGRVAYAVLSFGGFLGIGDKLFAVPMQAMQPDAENERFILDVPKDELENAPGFDKDDWPDMSDPAFQAEVTSFYGTV